MLSTLKVPFPCAKVSRKVFPPPQLTFASYATDVHVSYSSAINPSEIPAGRLTFMYQWTLVRKKGYVSFAAQLYKYTHSILLLLVNQEPSQGDMTENVAN